MKQSYLTMMGAGVLLLGFAFSGCTGKEQAGSEKEVQVLEDERGEHLHDVHGEGEAAAGRPSAPSKKPSTKPDDFDTTAGDTW